MAHPVTISSSRRKQIAKNANPLQAGILKFLSLHRPGDHELLTRPMLLPKRYTRYGSLLLLGSSFTTHSPAWSETYSALETLDRVHLYQTILDQFPLGTVTHIALNAPISRTIDLVEDADGVATENVMRSPSGLVPLCGHFGPAEVTDTSSQDGERKALQPVQKDFDAAYWVQTIQLQSIIQVWAPRWTMFSRGNFSEKARILQDGNNVNPFPGLTQLELSQPLDKVDVLDFYVGIGYFAFCYLARGAKRVWGWDLNGWSIEGLRRGCVENKWGIKVVRVADDGQLEGSYKIGDLVRDIEASTDQGNPIRCVAFWGDNKWAPTVMDQVSRALSAEDGVNELNIRHCNLGLLPTSQGSWIDAVKVLSPSQGCWLHVHENAEITAIDHKKAEVTEEFRRICSAQGKKDWSVTCNHVEGAKTYAPGVMHCVFDINIVPPR